MYVANWADEARQAVYLTFEGAWLPDEFVEAEHDLHGMLSEVGHAVSVVVHLQQPQPISMEMVPQMRSFIALDHPNRDRVVIVSPPDFSTGLSEVLRRAFGGTTPPHLQFSASLQDAEQML